MGIHISVTAREQRIDSLQIVTAVEKPSAIEIINQIGGEYLHLDCGFSDSEREETRSLPLRAQ